MLAPFEEPLRWALSDIKDESGFLQGQSKQRLSLTSAEIGQGQIKDTEF